MLIEFTIQDQALPTRFDIVPYILSPFSTHIKYPTQGIFAMKFILMLYVILTVYLRIKRMTWAEILTERVINSNLKDIAVIALQFSIFILKITGAYDADINPKNLLHPNVRKIAYDLHFIAIEFDLALFLDCISLILLTL